MSIPKPSKDEKQKDFHSRCMSAIFDEYGQNRGMQFVMMLGKIKKGI